VVNWWRSRSPVYHTDRRHLFTTPEVLRRSSLSAAAETCTC